MEDDSPLSKNISPKDYLRLQKENIEFQKKVSKLQTKVTELESQILQLKNEISKLKSKRPHGSGVRVDYLHNTINLHKFILK